MSTPETVTRNPEWEANFRRGYTHGVEAALWAVEHLLSDLDKGQLAKWKGHLLDWRKVGNLGEMVEAPHPPKLGS